MLNFSYKGSGYWTVCLIFRQKSLKELLITSVIFLVAIKTSFRLFSIPFFLFLPNNPLTVILKPSKGFERSLSA